MRINCARVTEDKLVEGLRLLGDMIRKQVK
jgi:DNA-binding transcriptional MocR family regulator